jgi:hypothetical protein
MAYVNRTRPRASPCHRRPGLAIAQGQTRDGLEEQLQLAKGRLENARRERAE